MIAQNGTLEISRSRLLHNVALMQRRVGRDVKLCATIKADAYGHGVAYVAELLRDAGVGWVCVYSLAEAMELAHLPFGILVLAPLVILEGETVSAEVLSALRGQVRVNITDKGTALRLAKALEAAGIEKPVNVHVQVDAGLTRMGVEPWEAEELVEVIAGLKQLQLEGVFAHFSHGDVPKHDTVEEQLRVLHAVADPLKQRYPHLMLHLQNSGGAWHVEDKSLSMVRVGIALYGLQPSMSDRVEGLLPIARVTAPILAIHERPVGTGVGYGHLFVTKRASRLAIVPVGYAEGYPRAMTNRSVAQVGEGRGVDVPVVGRVSMDQIILDVTDVPAVRVGDTVTVISWDAAKPNSLDAMACTLGTIGYELATHFGGRLRRVIVE